jgi:hypothetical protein
VVGPTNDVVASGLQSLGVSYTAFICTSLKNILQASMIIVLLYSSKFIGGS